MSKNIYNLLPQKVCHVISTRLNYDKLYEIRLRVGKPVTVNYDGKYFYLCSDGLSSSFEHAIFTDKKELSAFILRATDHSLYAVNENVQEGFLTLDGGVRVGLAGQIVRDGERVKTIKNFSSVNIRIPHEVDGCSKKVFDLCFNPQLNNTLLLSPPGAGKTTFLRDIVKRIGSSDKICNILLVDERNEISASCYGEAVLNVGVNTDIIAYCSKEYAFSGGIRGLRPDLIVTDEIYTPQDALAIEYACSVGVRVIASCHAENCMDLYNKNSFKDILKNKLFTRYVELSTRAGMGTCDGVYDENMNKIYSV